MDPNIQNSQENAPENQTIIVKIRSILSQNKFLIIVVTALTIISFGTTSYLLVAGSNKSFKPPRQENNLTTSEALPTLQPQPSTDPTSQPTQTLNPELQKDETATWSAFTSSKYSYSISYPPAWNASLADQEDEKILEYVVFNPESASGSATPAISLSYGTRTYQEALNIYQSGENITVGSQSATKIQNQNSHIKVS